MGGTQKLSAGGLYAEVDGETAYGGSSIRWAYNTEKEIIIDIMTELNEDDVFFDIGANLGIYSCFAVQMLSHGHVVAFEPYPPNVDQLKQNLRYNADTSEYEVLDVALSNSSGTVEFTAPDDDIGNQTAHINPNDDSICISKIPGDKLVADGSIPSPTVVKIDVEGVEPLVIDGLEKNLSKDSCRILYCEIHLSKGDGGRPSVGDYNESQESMFQKISELGFDIVQTERRGPEIHAKCKKV